MGSVRTKFGLSLGALLYIEEFQAVVSQKDANVSLVYRFKKLGGYDIMVNGKLMQVLYIS